MGNWSVYIEGVGCHHNGKPYDVEAAVGRCVDDLKKCGHSVTLASVTTGGKAEVVDPSVRTTADMVADLVGG